jgi:putative Mn2+ efflux pump MntP
MNMGPYQTIGLAGIACGMLLIVGWVLYEFFKVVDLPTTIMAGIVLIIAGICIVLATLVNERRKDVKTERFFK